MKLLWCGDSTVAGRTGTEGNYTVAVDNDVKTATDLLNQRYGAGTVISVNAGVPGTTAPEWWFGTNLMTKNFAGVLTDNPDAGAVVLKLGINDAFSPYLGPDDFIYCMGQMAGAARSLGRQIILATPNPIDLAHNSILWELQHRVKWLAGQINAPLIDHWDAITRTFPNTWKSMLPDKVHPSNALYKMMGTVSFVTLENAIKGALT